MQISIQPDNYSFAQRLHIVMAYRKIDRKQAAKMVGKPPSDFLKILKGEVKNPALSVVKDLAIGLNCTTDFLLGLTDVIDRLNYADLIVKHLIDLEPEDQEFCLIHIRKLAESFRELYDKKSRIL
jgi:transcriptional regulator with XRE-family HTH domain